MGETEGKEKDAAAGGKTSDLLELRRRLTKKSINAMKRASYPPLNSHERKENKSTEKGGG